MRVLTDELAAHLGQTIQLRGWVHYRRDLGGIQFLVLRDRRGLAQCVFGPAVPLPIPESCVEVEGRVVVNEKAPGGLELVEPSLRVLSLATEAAPVEVSKEEWRANPETLLDYRYVSLRGLRERAVLRVQAAIVAAFREFLEGEGYTEIFTPKIVAAGAEGGANLFALDYFGQRAFLAQSPQFYKQMMVGVYERVFETAPVYRAEEHATSRHLNEYLSLDCEVGFIESEEDLMQLEERLLAHICARLGERCVHEFEQLGVSVPSVPKHIPRMSVREARTLIQTQYGYTVGGKDIDPEGERILCRHMQETEGSEWVFLTRYPRDARPPYTYPADDGTTRSFDLLYRGLEVTTGGQRIHEYEMLVASLLERGLRPEAWAGGYLETFRHGMPPHGGFAIGAERLTARMLGISNVRYARAFPRDRHRLTP